MSKKLYESENILAIADALREKLFTTEKFKVSDIPNAIKEIPSGLSLYDKMDMEVPSLTDLSALPDLSSLSIAEDELVIYYTYNLTDNSLDKFYSFCISGTKWNADIGYIENGEFIAESNLCSDRSSGSYLTGNNLSELTTLDYPVIRIKPSSIGNITSIGISSPNINGTKYDSLSQNIIDVRLSLPKTTNVANTSTYKTIRWQGENLQSITTFYKLFYNRYNLEVVKFSNINTSNVTSFEYMFISCFNLQEVDTMQLYVTNKCTTLSNMFATCPRLKEINIPDWDTSNVTSLNSTFGGCHTLKKIPNILNWNTSKVKSYTSVFSGCYLFSGKMDLSKWNITSNATSLYGMFNSCMNLTAIIFPENIDTSNVTSLASLFLNCYKLLYINTYKDWDVTNVTNLNSIFCGCASLIEIDLSKWSNTKNISFNSLFNGCYSAKTLKLGLFDGAAQNSQTTASNNISSMFCNCYNVEEIDMSSCTNFKYTTTMRASNAIFLACRKVKKIILPVDGINGSDLNSLFYGCYALKEIVNFDKIDFSQTVSCSNLFNGCYSLEEIDLSTVHISNKCTNFSSCFSGCRSLKELNFPSDWDTSKVTSMSGFLRDCRNLKKITIPFLTPLVATFLYVLYDAYSLEEVYLTQATFTKITSASNIISPGSTCCKLKELRFYNTLPALNCTYNTYLLSRETLLNIFENLPTKSGLKITIGPVNKAKLTEEDLAIAINKGWTIA